MKRVETIAAARQELALQRDKTIGLVPTMGFLHAGHLQLIQQAKQECDYVVLSIFVNPLQFGPNEDFERYPRDAARDAALAEEAGVDLVFAPSVEEMHPVPSRTQVQVNEITDVLCGASRPGHFAGVATVVAKLFTILSPDRAYFGQKDAQQLAVIEQLVRDLHFPITVVGCPIVREADGLALSSRNVYLSPQERAQAPILQRSLEQVGKGLQQKKWTNAAEINAFLRQQIETQSLAHIDYVETLTYPDLQPPTTLDTRLLIAVAVYFGKTRLIDNLLYSEESAS